MKKERKTLMKNLHDINSMYNSDHGETILVGSDENGDELHLTISTYELIHWIDKEDLKESLIKYIQKI